MATPQPAVIAPPTDAAPTDKPSQTIPEKPKERGFGIVKSVLSGDSIIVQEEKSSTNGPPLERQLSFAALTAPRMAKLNDPSGSKDEPFAWESREFLRKKIIGKKIFFLTDYTAPGGRSYATIFLGGEGGENLNHTMVSEGWCTVFKSKGNEPAKKAAEKEPLYEAEEQAIAEGKGLHAGTQDRKRALAAIRPNPKFDANTLLTQLKGKTLEAVVEQVRTGSALRVSILPTHHNIVVLLSGVQSPMWKRKDGDPTAEPQPEPFAREAKFFVEQNVLNRDVELVLESVDKQGNFFGTVVASGRDVAEELLKAGLANYVAWSAAGKGPQGVSRLKEAERIAKNEKRRLYTNYVEKAADPNAKVSLKEFVGKVLAVVNTGALLVLPKGQGAQEIQVNISSIKIPRPSFPGEEAEERQQDEAVDKLPAGQAKEKRRQERAAERQASLLERSWAAEGKEVLRKRLIGKDVRVVFDYANAPKQREAEVKAPAEKSYYTVYTGEIEGPNALNIAVMLVEAGLATAMQFRGGEDRSPDYELLVMCEGKAKEQKKGIHSGKEKAQPRINDLTIDTNVDEHTRQKQIQAAKAFLPHLLVNRGEHHVLVEYVFSGARFKLTLLKEMTSIFFSLAGIRVPRQEENKEVSNKAVQFTRERLHQREFDIQIDAIDKGGNFLGNLVVPNPQAKKGEKQDRSYAVELVENGLAYVQEGADKQFIFKDLKAAEEVAKSKRLNLWVNYDPEEEKRRLDEENEKAAKEITEKQLLEVYVTEVVDGVKFYVQIANAESAGLEELVNSLTQVSLDEGKIGSIMTGIKAGDNVRARFTEDDRWYRAKVTAVNGDRITVNYYDYGNSETINVERIRPLPHGFTVLPPQAQQAVLSYIKPMKPDNEYARDALLYLRELTGGKKLSATVEYKDRDAGALWLSLEDPATSQNINVAMVRAGLALIDKDRRKRRFFSAPLYIKLEQTAEEARKKRAGIYQYGDAVDSDEDEAVGAPKGKKGPTPAPAKPAAGAKEAAPAGKKK